MLTWGETTTDSGPSPARPAGPVSTGKRFYVAYDEGGLRWHVRDLERADYRAYDTQNTFLAARMLASRLNWLDEHGVMV